MKYERLSLASTILSGLLAHESAKSRYNEDHLQLALTLAEQLEAEYERRETIRKAARVSQTIPASAKHTAADVEVGYQGR